MPTFSPDRFHAIGCELFEAAGCSPDDARAVVDHLVESSLFGLDSHGSIRYYEYVQAIRDGRSNPRAAPRIVQEHPCTAVVDAGGALGQVGATFATRLAIDKAREYGVASVGLRNTSHIGRVGAYPLMAARQDMIGLIFVNAGREGYKVAPFGAIDGRLSTNPIGFAAPRGTEDPILADLTTSVVADGKIRVAINQGKQVPEGWITDAQGNPTTDPRDAKADPPGALLPLGGIAAHKGFALALVVDILSGAMSGQGCASGEKVMKSNGVFLTVYNIAHFTDLDTYRTEIETLVTHVRSSRPAKGFSEVLLPGEPEFRMAEKRRKEGIPVDEKTWETIKAEARHFGVDTDAWEE